MSKSIAEIRAMAAAFHDGAAGFDNNSRLNAYECDGESGFGTRPDKPGCGAYIVTVDREPGVTPFMLKCGLCGQMTHSKFYRVQPTLIATHEWYRPDSLAGLKPYELEHVEKGGLLLRPIGDGDWIRADATETPSYDAKVAEFKRQFDETHKIERLTAMAALRDTDISKLEGTLKREDFPNRQQYRAAKRADRKPLMKPPGFA